MKIKYGLYVIAGACVLLAAHSAKAAVVVIDNLASGTQSFSASLSGPTATGFFGGPFADREVAFSFVTGSTASVLTELMFVANLGNANLDPIQLTLSTGASVPGGTNPVILGSVAPAQSTPTSQTMTITPTVPPPLAANTQYWVHFTVPSGGSIYTITSTNTPTYAPGWLLESIWYNAPNSSWIDVTSGPVARIRMSVESVPEPESAVLGALACALFFRRRRR